MSILATYRKAIREHGLRAAVTVTRYYVARAAGAVTGPGRVCPVCNTAVREFLPFVEFHYGAVRNRAVCPTCGALERHRAYARFYREFIPTHFKGRVDILHASSEESLVRVLREFVGRYDLSDYESPPPGHMQLDICNPHLPPASYDLIVLNHVLMCVPQDRQAVQALAKLLRPGGMILAGESILAGEATHSQSVPGYGVRFNQYGDADLAARFAPLQVHVIDVAEAIEPAERARFGIAEHEMLMVLRQGDRAKTSTTAANRA